MSRIDQAVDKADAANPALRDRLPLAIRPYQVTAAPAAEGAISRLQLYFTSRSHQPLNLIRAVTHIFLFFYFSFCTYLRVLARPKPMSFIDGENIRFKLRHVRSLLVNAPYSGERG